MADYYAKQASGDDPFNWIKAHPLMTADTIRRYPFDHAGKGETSLLMALCPEGVDMTRFTPEKWYVQDAKEASAGLGAQGSEMILAHMRAVLGIPAMPR
jgi:creatinine amidohydrolase